MDVHSLFNKGASKWATAPVPARRQLHPVTGALFTHEEPLKPTCFCLIGVGFHLSTFSSLICICFVFFLPIMSGFDEMLLKRLPVVPSVATSIRLGNVAMACVGF